MLQSYDYFSSSVSSFQIQDSLRDLTQPVTLVDDRSYLSGLHELAHDGHVLVVQFRYKHDELLAHEPRKRRRRDRASQKEPGDFFGRSGDDAYALGIQDAPACR